MGINLFSESYFGKHIPIIQKCVEQLSIDDRLDGYTGKAQSLLVDIPIYNPNRFDYGNLQLFSVSHNFSSNCVQVGRNLVGKFDREYRKPLVHFVTDGLWAQLAMYEELGWGGESNL